MLKTYGLHRYVTLLWSFSPNTKCKKTCAFMGYASARLEEAHSDDVREPLPGLGEEALLSLSGTGDRGGGLGSIEKYNCLRECAYAG